MDTPRFIWWRRTDPVFLVLSAVLVFVLAGVLTLLYGVHTVRKIDGPSMEPTLVQGDRILVTRGYEVPAVGDIVSVATMDRSGQKLDLIKRVVALPGDTVEIVGDSAYVNGELSTVAPRAQVGGHTYRLGPMTVPDGAVFIMGDNRPLSLDSRRLGFVPIGSIRGKVVAVIFPLSRAGAIDE